MKKNFNEFIIRTRNQKKKEKEKESSVVEPLSTLPPLSVVEDKVLSSDDASEEVPNVSSEEEYWYDTSGEKPHPEVEETSFIHSPNTLIQSPVTPASFSDLDPEVWSTVNWLISSPTDVPPPLEFFPPTVII